MTTEALEGEVIRAVIDRSELSDRELLERMADTLNAQTTQLTYLCERVAMAEAALGQLASDPKLRAFLPKFGG